MKARRRGVRRRYCTVTVTEFDVIVLLPLTYCAKTVVWPAVAPASTHIGSDPFETVTMFGVPVCQVTLEVTSIFCPPAIASAVRQSFPLAVEFTERLKEVTPFGPRVMLVTFPRVTVAVAVALAVPEDAVMVLVPAETPLTRPPVLIVATLGVSLDQHTVVPVQLVPAVRVIAFPLLSVPAAFNCTVSPMLTVGAEGSIAMLETVGFTKNPLHPTPMANKASVAKAPARRSFCLFDDIRSTLPRRACSAQFSILYDTIFARSTL